MMDDIAKEIGREVAEEYIEENEITYDMVESYLVWQALAKMANANASQLKQSIQIKLSKHPDKLESIDIEGIVVKREHTKVDWNADIIKTIEDVKGVSDADKAKLFKPPAPPKPDGVHLNSIAKKYKGVVADRVGDARQESGLTIKIVTNKVQNQIVSDKAKSLIKNTIEIEGELDG